MSRAFVYLMLGLMGFGGTVIFVQNLDLRLPIKFLGLRSFPLPVGLSVLVFAGIGAIVAVVFNGLLFSFVEFKANKLQEQLQEEEPEIIDVEYIDE